MDAVEYAHIVQKHVLVRDPDAVERVLIGEAPAYAGRLVELADAARREAEAVQPRLVEELRASPSEAAKDAARAVGPMRGRSGCGLLLALLAVATGFALSFGRLSKRVRIDPTDVLPWAMALLVVAAIGCAIAALPIRRADPPGPAVAFTSGVFTVLSLAAVWLSVPVVARLDPQLAPWLWSGAAATLVTGAIAVACMIARRGLPREAEREAVVDDFRSRVQTELRAVRERAEAEAAAAFALLEPEQRASLERTQLAVRAELQRRGIPVPAEVPAPPCVGIVGRAVELGAAASGATAVRP